MISVNLIMLQTENKKNNLKSSDYRICCSGLYQGTKPTVREIVTVQQPEDICEILKRDPEHSKIKVSSIYRLN